MKKVVGFNAILDALKKGRLKSVTIDPSKKRHAKVIEIIKSGIFINWEANSNIVEGYVDFTNKGSLDIFKNRSEAIVLILDGIQDVGNFGAIIRSAAAFKVDMIIIPKNGSVKVTDRVRAISSGAIADVNIVEGNLVDSIQKLQDLGFWIYGADAKGDKKYRNTFKGKCCIVMGSETSGMRKKVKERCDFILSIPIEIESLNVAQATSILLSEAYYNLYIT